MIGTNINSTWLHGVIAALCSSLCCIAPLMAVLGGVSGLASFFLWIEPARPYLIGATLLFFTFAWRRQLNVNSPTMEDCCKPKKVSFCQSKKFLLIMTLSSVVLISLPYYSWIFYAKPFQSSTTVLPQENLKRAQFTVEGMGCGDCTKHIDCTLAKVPGVLTVFTSIEQALTTVRYDPKKVSAETLKNKIDQIGYHATVFKEQIK